MSDLLQTLDWRSSPLGPPHAWSAGLQATMSLMLPAKAQIVLFWGPQYVALYNEAYVPTIGAKHPHALGRPAIEHWSELWDDLEPLLRGVRETGQTFSATDRPFYIERSGFGETAWFDVSYSAVRESDGSVGGVLCIVTETTRRVQFQRRQAFLLELGEALRGLDDAEAIREHATRRLQQELDASCVCFDEDPARFSIPASLQVPVLRAGELQAMLSVEFARPRVLCEDECLLVEECARQTWDAMSHARAQRDLQAAFAEMKALNESLEERVGAILAEREAAIVELHEARKMEMVGQLSGGIAHDFNNMLTPIIASLELIQRRPDDLQRTARLTQGALQAAERARNLVGRLLSFARRQTLTPQTVALASLVAEMHELIAHSLGPTIQFEVEVDEYLPTVVVDPHQLELALLNLVVNARDAMEQGGRLRISAGPGEPPEGVRGQQLWLKVSDSGCGMSADVLRRCAEPFFSTKGVGRGTGLGLSMVQGLAGQSGGGMEVRSWPGRGTEVTLWLPVGTVEQEGQDEFGDAVPMARHLNRVLLVDDEEMVRNATALQLRDLGYKVTEADGPAQARRLIEAGLELDILVTDQIMADETGSRFAHDLRQWRADLPVLIITGYANLPPQALHEFEVLRKPFRRLELARSLARLLGSG
ncbi:ATP-binding protein [Pseudomonas sp. NyZ201]|uniref:ATP-binding protein n=1 Tax=Pseudomonas sp. NyZ201 TaxID=3409857 RepID=UPI003CF5335E